MKITFVDAVRIALQKYFVFRGTATRPEFWYFVLFTLLVGIVLSTIDSVLWPQPQLPENATLEEIAAQGAAFTPLSSLGQLFLLIPSLSVTSRRLHDAGFSGKWLLLYLAPLAYAIFAGIGITTLIAANGVENLDPFAALFLILPIIAIALAIGLAMLIMNLMPTRSFYDGNKYADPNPLSGEDSAGTKLD